MQGLHGFGLLFSVNSNNFCQALTSSVTVALITKMLPVVLLSCPDSDDVCDLMLAGRVRKHAVLNTGNSPVSAGTTRLFFLFHHK